MTSEMTTLKAGDLRPWQPSEAVRIACEMAGEGGLTPLVAETGGMFSGPETYFRTLCHMGKQETATLRASSCVSHPHLDARLLIADLITVAEKGFCKSIIYLFDAATLEVSSDSSELLSDAMEIVIVDFISYRKHLAWSTVNGKEPIIFAQYAYFQDLKKDDFDNNESQMAEVALRYSDQALMNKKDSGIHQIIISSAETLQIVLEFFTENSRCITDPLRRKLQKHTDKELVKVPKSHTTFISLLFKPSDMSTIDYKWIRKSLLRFQCAYCVDNVGTHRCAKCMVYRYCSRACQVNHWRSEHKYVCNDITKEAFGN